MREFIKEKNFNFLRNIFFHDEEEEKQKDKRKHPCASNLFCLEANTSLSMREFIKEKEISTFCVTIFFMI